MPKAKNNTILLLLLQTLNFRYTKIRYDLEIHSKTRIC